MTNSPQRVLLLGLIICLLLGFALELVNVRLPNYFHTLPSNNFLDNNDNLSIGRFYWRIGEIDKAIEEYQRVIPTLPKSDSDLAHKELKKLIRLNQSTLGRVVENIAYYAWFLPQRLFVLASVFFLMLVVLIIHRRIRKSPRFVIQSFYDQAGLGIGSNLSQIAIDRIHEIEWIAKNLEGTSELIADNIEMPALGLMSEGDNQGAIELLDMALLFSIGSTGLPFSRVLDSLKLWLEQPPFLVRGIIERHGDIIVVKMLLVNRKKKNIERVWHSEISYKEDVLKVVDAIIYPLLFHFNNFNASCWEALQALHLGLEEFQIFKENPLNAAHLESAQQELEHALLLDPGYDLAKYNLSLLLLAMGEFERSRDYLRELSAMSPDPHLRLRAKYNYGVALFHMSQDWAYEQAVKIFQELLDQEESKQ